MQRTMVCASVAVLLATAGCLGGGAPATPDPTIDPDDPPFRLGVDDGSRYTDVVVWPDGRTTRRLRNGSLAIGEPGNDTLRVLADDEVVASHGFVVHHDELAGCNRDVLQIAGTALGPRSHTEIACGDPHDVVDRPG